jgi:hypothetical protein
MVQHLARQRRETPFSMRGWQARASLCNTLFLFRPRPRRKGGLAPRMDDPGVRHRTRRRNPAPDLHSSSPHCRRSDPGAGGHAFGCVVFGGVRFALLRGGGLDLPHPAERRSGNPRGESSLSNEGSRRSRGMGRAPSTNHNGWGTYNLRNPWSKVRAMTTVRERA